MKKKPHSISIPMLLFLLVFTGQLVKAQCNPNNPQITVDPGTCLNNGSITIELPGAPPCLGWQAILTYPSGLESVRNIPDTGNPIVFMSLFEGDYFLRFANGPTEIPYANNPITLTTTYQAMDIGTSISQPSCPLGADFYTPDGTLGIQINSGGNGPFLYEATSQFGAQSFGPTMDRSHTFGNMVGGESVSFTVTDTACGIAQTQTPIITDNTDRPSGFVRSEFLRKCAPDCSRYQATFKISVYSSDRINTMTLPGNATIRVNGGAPQDLTVHNINGSALTFRHLPGLSENDSYELSFNDGCYLLNESNTVIPVDDDTLNVIPSLSFDASTCTTSHRIDGNARKERSVPDQDLFSMFCETNSINLERETAPGVWIPIAGDNGAANNFSFDLPTAGHYRVIARDDCHTITREFETLPEADPLEDVSTQSSFSVLEGTGAVRIDLTSSPVSNSPVPGTLLEVNPVPFVPSLTTNLGQPFTLGGSYTYNFPIVYTTNVNRNYLGDLPPGNYELKVSLCGSERTIPFEVNTLASYNPFIATLPGCSNSARVLYDMGGVNVANYNRDYINVELWTDNGSGGLGTLISGDIPPNGMLGEFNNLASGDYLIRFSSVNFLSSNPDEVFSAATLSNEHREFTIPVTVRPYQSITAGASGTFCNLSDPTSGIILAEITSGTPTYPIVFELFETSDLGTPVRTYMETDLSVSSHVFENVPEADYLIRITTPCDALDFNLDLTSANSTVQIQPDSDYVCTPGTPVELSVNLPQSLYDINWSDGLGNPLGTGVTITVNVNPASTYTATYSLKPVFCAGTQVETLSITVPLRPGLSLVGPEITNCNVQGDFYTLIAQMDGTAPYDVTGTGAPGTFNGNIWTSDPIPAGTDYNVRFEDVNACDIILADVSPICCDFDVVCPTFPTTIVECYQDVPTTTSLTQAEFEALGNGDGSLGSSFCGVVEISAANDPDPTNCNSTITRTYTVTEYDDSNGDGIRNPGEDTVLNTVECSQLILLQDSTAPTFVEPLPTLVTASCENVPPPAVLTAVDNCDPNITVMFNEVIGTTDSCGTSYEITRNWTAADCTGNVTSHSQIIVVEDNEAPAFVELLPIDMETTCDSIPDIWELTAVDNCDTSIEVIFTEMISNESTGGGYEIHRTWTATDCNDNEASHTQIITVLPHMEFMTQEICLEDDALDLTTLLPSNFDAAGVFEVLTGNGSLDGSSFDPLNFGVGEHQISYSSDTGNCEYFVDFTILVNTHCAVCGLDKITTSDTVTANGDGVNDMFEIKGVENCNYIFRLRFFNRWGNLVYQSNDYRNDWGGSAPDNSFGNSDKLPSGTYYYIITVQNKEVRPIDGYIYFGAN